MEAIFVPNSIWRVLVGYLLGASLMPVFLLAISIQKHRLWPAEWILLIVPFLIWYVCLLLFPGSRGDGNYVLEPIILGVLLSISGIFRYTGRKSVVDFPIRYWLPVCVVAFVTVFSPQM